MYRPITKWARSIARADTIPEMIRKAFKVAEQEKPGVSVLELPEDIAKQDAVKAPLRRHTSRRPAADYKVVRAAVDAIAAAKNPIILSGNGAIRKRAAKQLQRLAHKAGIGVVNTFMGKGAVPRRDDHCLFTIGMQQRDHINTALDAADLVIAVGYDLVEYAPMHWNRLGGKTIVHIDFWPAEVDEDYVVDVEIVSDVADALWQINEEINARYEGDLPLFDIADRAELRQRIADDLLAECDDADFPMKPQRILCDVRSFMDADDIVLSDVGAHKMWIARYYQCDEPNTCLISNGFCSMGFAFPGAIGAKFAHPERRVLAICGDGGFLMNVQDLETAVRRKINFVTLIWMDGGYGLIEWKQRDHFDGRHSDLAFGNPDFEELARAFGAWGRTLSAPEQLMPALEEAFRQPGPALIAIPVNYAENVRLTERLGALQFAI
jgi:acetolactate synthase-1/2/3 large subunit